MFKTTVKIDGMMCSHCEAHMSEAFEKSFKTKSVTSSHENKESVIISENTLDAESLKKTVEEAGYTFISAQSEPYEKKGFSLFGKNK